MKNGDTGTAVRDLQARLEKLGYPVSVDGWYGDRTESAVRAMQRAGGLIVDGIAGPRTLDLAYGRDTRRYLGQADIEAAAALLDVQVAAIMAVSDVETAGAGFLDDGRPVILYERHVMYRQLAASGLDADRLAARYPALVNPERGGYMGGAAEHYRLTQAKAIHETCALAAASWGRYQIMGYHHAACGHADVREFAAAMAVDEAMQLAAFVRYLASDTALIKALRGGKWAAFARAYNGPAYRDNDYDIRLARAYARYGGGA